MTAVTAWPVEELGTAADLHPGWCRTLRHKPGQHRSVTFTVAGWRIWATADTHHITVHRAGGGLLSPADYTHLAAVEDYLTSPAARRT